MPLLTNKLIRILHDFGAKKWLFFIFYRNLYLPEDAE
jgi:hypothetical protein